MNRRSRRVVLGTLLGVTIGVPSSLAEPIGRMRARTYATGTSLVVNGQTTCAILFPAEPPAWRAMAVRLADGLRVLGAADVPLIPDTEAVPQRLGPIPDALAGKSLILLGNLKVNRAFFPLYANYYTYCDMDYPGGDGHVLRTVVRPFGRPVNYLLVGGSTVDGAAIAVERLLGRLGELEPGGDVELPYCLDVGLAPALSRALDPIVAELSDDAGVPEEAPYGQARDAFTARAHLYFYTGHDALAHGARRWALALVQREPGPIRISDYHLVNLAAAWRRVSVSPAFSAADRRLIDDRMLQTAAEQETAWWRQHDASAGIGTRHQTTGMLGWWSLMRTLQELGEPDAAFAAYLAERRRECEAYLDGLLRHYSDDSDDYQSADSVHNTASYALQTGQFEWFHSGLARRAAERILAITDNQGAYAGIMGYGEALPGWERFTLNAGLLLGACDYVYEDSSFRWLLMRFPPLHCTWGPLHPWRLGLFTTDDEVPPNPPEWFHGSKVLRLTPYRLERLQIASGRAAGLVPPTVNADTAFDKLVVRRGVRPDDPYLLLQGMADSFLSTIDMNAIIRYTDQGRLWLIHNTSLRSLFFKNAVYISNGTNEEPVPCAAELIAHAEFPGATLAATRLSPYRGTAWTRNLLVADRGFALVIDQIAVHMPGRYVIDCVWRTPAFASLNGTAWQSTQDGVEFTLEATSLEGLTSRRLPVRDGATRPTILRQTRRLTATAGQDVFFENLLWTSGPHRRQRCQLKLIAPGAVLIRHEGSEGAPFFLAAANAQGIQIDGVVTDATMLLLDGRHVWLVAGSHLSIGQETILKASDRRDTVTSIESDRIAAWLERRWHEAAAPSVSTAPSPSASRQEDAGLLWSRSGPATRGTLVEGVRFVPHAHIAGRGSLATNRILPVLRAEPRLSPVRGSGFAIEVPDNASAEWTEPVLAPARGAEFVLELPIRRRLTEISLFGDTFSAAAEAMPAASLRLELTFSNDGFGRDERTRIVEVPRRPSFQNLYKGHAYLFEEYRSGSLAVDASAIRVRVLEAPSDTMLLTDVQVRAEGEGDAQPVHVRIVDLDSDNTDDVLAWTRDGQVLVLDALGRERWRRTFAAGLLALDAWDLAGDGRREVVASCANRRTLVLNTNGTLRWERDWSDIYEQTDQRFYSDGANMFGMAAWRPETASNVELIFTGYWFATRLDPDGTLKTHFRRDGHVTEIRSIPEDLPGAGGLVMRSDAPWNGPVTLEWWSAATGSVEATNAVPNGTLVHFEVNDFDADGAVETLLATSEGIGLYAPGETRPRWEHLTEAPPVGVGVIPPTDAVPVRFVYGREDGYLFVVRADGTLVRSVLLDEALRCLTVVPDSTGRPVILVGTDAGLRRLDAETLAGTTRRDRSYQSLAPLRQRGRQIVLAVTAAGDLRALIP